MVSELSPADVHDIIEGEADVTVVDIRTRPEFDLGHIPGAVNLPMVELTDRIDEIDWGDQIVVVCPVGEASIQAARLLASYEGIDGDAVASMEGGYDAWEGDLVVPADEQATD